MFSGWVTLGLWIPTFNQVTIWWTLVTPVLGNGKCDVDVLRTTRTSTEEDKSVEDIIGDETTGTYGRQELWCGMVNSRLINECT